MLVNVATVDVPHTPAERKDGNAFATVETDGTFPASERTFGAPFDGTMIFERVDHRFNPSHKLLLRWGADLSDARLEIGERRNRPHWSSRVAPLRLRCSEYEPQVQGPGDEMPQGDRDGR